MSNNKQNRDGLPASILEEKRFFELYGSSKTSLPSAWNNPENWKYIDKIPEDKYFGFAIGNQSNYLLIDADHVIQNGVMIPWVRTIFERLLRIASTYWEYSMSGTGWHMICDLGDFADNFPRTANSYTEIIIDMNPAEYDKLPKEEKEVTPKVEMFYHTAGRYVYLTGKHDD